MYMYACTISPTHSSNGWFSFISCWWVGHISSHEDDGIMEHSRPAMAAIHVYNYTCINNHMAKKSYNESTQDVGVNIFHKIIVLFPAYVRHVGPALCGNGEIEEPLMWPLAPPTKLCPLLWAEFCLGRTLHGMQDLSCLY